MTDTAKPTPDLAKAFHSSLFPAGLHCPLENPTRTFLTGVLGRQFGDCSEYWADEMSSVLRRIADSYDCMRGKNQ